MTRILSYKKYFLLAEKIKGKLLVFTAKRMAGKLLILISTLFQACATLQQQAPTLADRVDSLFYSDFFKASQAGISVYDLTENKPLYKHKEKLLLRPASNQKILTTAAAYLFLGKDYNFKTSVYHTGEIKDSVCQGDVYFIGGFDPDFTAQNLDSVVKEIKRFGINKINGNLYADVSAMDSLFWGEGWMWNDDPEPYEAYLTPLCINKNSIQVISSVKESGKPAEIELLPPTKYLQIQNSTSVIDSGKKTLFVTRDWLNRKNTILANGNLTKTSRPDTTAVNVFNPTNYFLTLARESFERNGISFSGKIDTLTLRGEAIEIFTFKRSIQNVIRRTNKVSDNLSAEMVLRALGLKFGKPSSADKGIKFVDSLISLAGLNPKNYRIADGSGLSYYNLVSPELLCEVLKFYYYQPDLYERLFNSFPVSGIDGTLSNRMKNGSAFKRVHAKTGTISGVSSLSGYIESKNNHLIVFSILIQNFVGPSSQARKIQDKICEIISEMN